MTTDKEERSAMEIILGQAMGHDIPEEVSSKMRLRLEEFRVRLESEKPRTRASRLSVWRKTLPLLVTACALLVIGYLAVGKGSGIALADVIQRVREARTFQFTVAFEIKDAPGPTMQVAVLGPGRVRSVTSVNGVETINITNTAEGKVLTLMPAQKKAILTTLEGGSRSQSSPLRILDQIREIQGRAREVLPTTYVDGRNARGFVCEKQGSTWTIWADCKTCELVRVDIETTTPVATKMSMKNIVCNMALDESLFSTVPPPGYTLQERRVTRPTAVESDLIEGLRCASTLAQGNFPGQIDGFAIKQFVAQYGLQDDISGEAGAGLKFSGALLFVLKTLSPKHEWEYFGDRVTLGEADKPLCWWRKIETDPRLFRVVYGDLSARDVSETDLPPVPEVRAK
jgi:outer membrane lipoprotein-sorting protein